MSETIAGVELDCRFEKPGGFGATFRLVPGQCVGLQHIFVGRQTRRRLAARPLDVGGLYSADKRADDLLHDLVLDGKYAGQITVEFFTPDMAAGLGVDQLRGDANALTHAPYASFDDIPNI